MVEQQKEEYRWELARMVKAAEEQTERYQKKEVAMLAEI